MDIAAVLTDDLINQLLGDAANLGFVAAGGQEGLDYDAIRADVVAKLIALGLDPERASIIGRAFVRCVDDVKTGIESAAPSTVMTGAKN